ncbi:MAG: tRNA (N(6)-L-threonylcarbamoyladenosine(37)-C(2))-methylthiotransferase MtaB [Candidatus Delongbacteria bacterium]|jgi:threonylcarbamoyladenosine tRNA methylthiotransferase MtaB|nr:tRNA (N(6)-L-threonylcarbamoyladenosine(37)-C(2))-methylthiotransferase MtaB [Candidatus Delongbacteria bacterium]
MKKTAYIYTLGCKLNIYESEVVKDILVKDGYEIAIKPADAGVVIVNSCTVTSNADSKLYKFLKKVSVSNPNATKVVMGCYSQLESEKLKKENIADIILGVDNKYQVNNILKDHQKESNYIHELDISKVGFEDYHLTKYKNHTRAFLKIQDGCDNFCTYCTISKARGRSRSKSPSSIMKDIENLAKNGYKEIILSGIDLGSYKYEESEKLFLLKDIIKEILTVEGFRLRISSVEPWCFDDELIDLFVKDDRICPHFHIPLQSASDNILKKMNRKYNVEIFDTLIRKLKKKKDVIISTDIIVGFPTETEDEYEQSKRYLNDSLLDTAHIFSYSDRPHAASRNLFPKILKKDINRRSKELRNIAEEKYNQFYKKNIENDKKIIIEKIKKTDDKYLYSGITDNYLQLSFTSTDKYKKGDLVNIRVK